MPVAMRIRHFAAVVGVALSGTLFAVSARAQAPGPELKEAPAVAEDSKRERVGTAWCPTKKDRDYGACMGFWGAVGVGTGWLVNAGCISTSVLGGAWPAAPACPFLGGAVGAWTGASGAAFCSPSMPDDPPAPKPAPGSFWRPEEPQFSPAVSGPVDALQDGWFPADIFSGSRLLGPSSGSAVGDGEVSLGNDSGAHGVAPDNGAVTNGISGVSLGGDVSVGSGGYVIGEPDPNDDPGDGLGDPGVGGE